MCSKEDGMIKSVAGMTVRSRVEVCERLTEVDEVYMCLVYTDGSSQLREHQSSSNVSIHQSQAWIFTGEDMAIFNSKGTSGEQSRGHF